MKQRILILFLLALTAISVCGSKIQKPQRADFTFRSEVRTIIEDDEVRWDTIVVYLTDAQGQTTKLYTQALPLDTVNWNKESIGEITEEDWNFDGFPDLQVCTGPMNGFGKRPKVERLDVCYTDAYKHFATLKHQAHASSCKSMNVSFEEVK